VQNPIYEYTEEGVYEVTLTVSNGSCYSTYRQQIEVGDMTGAINLNAFASLRIFPNPATDEVTVEFLESYSGPMKLNITNAAGSLVNTQIIPTGSKRISINTASLSSGTYQFQMIGEEGVSVRRITIIR
jgi:PKD repeat protein